MSQLWKRRSVAAAVYSEALAVNPSGQIVGSSQTADGTFHAFSWTHEGGMVDLGTLGGTSSRAVAVLPSGDVVGQSYTAGNTAYHVVLWENNPS